MIDLPPDAWTALGADLQRAAVEIVRRADPSPTLFVDQPPDGARHQQYRPHGDPRMVLTRVAAANAASSEAGHLTVVTTHALDLPLDGAETNQINRNLKLVWDGEHRLQAFVISPPTPCEVTPNISVPPCRSRGTLVAHDAVHHGALDLPDLCRPPALRRARGWPSALPEPPDGRG
jgi:hypothetical protein